MTASTQRTELELAVPDLPVERVHALLDAPATGTPRVAALLAHGAGASMESAFLEDVALRLAAGGLAVLRFRYPYMERAAREGRRFPPDRRPALEATHLAALAELRRRYPDARCLLAGKSMGGRMASLLAAEGTACDGLAFLGYPLHPAKQPEKLRSEHFACCLQPALFLQGTRDALCDLDLLRTELELYGGAHELHVVEGADHGFDVPKRSGRDADDVRAELARVLLDWVARVLH
ncbi:MAG: dienelactone hydrolase family protein [Planctomycetes bacterium]|nr:dienelactone hydrolase family protein [Planctomycetota bacterium]